LTVSPKRGTICAKHNKVQRHRGASPYRPYAAWLNRRRFLIVKRLTFFLFPTYQFTNHQFTTYQSTNHDSTIALVVLAPVAIKEKGDINKMTTHRKTAIIVGVLFIIATAFLFIGGAFYGPILDAPDYLDNAYPNRIIVIIGLLIEFICIMAIPLISVFLFPVLRKHNEALALGYVGFRFLEAVLYMVVQINKLSLINVSQDYLNRGGMDASYFQTMGSSIQSENYWAFSIYVVVFTLGALMLYSVLYRSKLIPRFISAWGFIAAAFLLTGTVLQMVELKFIASELVFELIFAAPIAVNEMVLAIWLIVKGFNPSAIASGSAK